MVGGSHVPTSSVSDVVSLKCQRCPDSMPHDAPAGTADKFTGLLRLRLRPSFSFLRLIIFFTVRAAVARINLSHEYSSRIKLEICPVPCTGSAFFSFLEKSCDRCGKAG